MSRPRGKSSESQKLNLSLRSPINKPSRKSLQNKIAAVSSKQYETKLKTLSLLRELNSKTYQVPRNPRVRDNKKPLLSTSLQTDTTCLDLSTIENSDIVKSDSYRKIKLPEVAFIQTVQSPLSRILETDQDLEKTPAFKAAASKIHKPGSSSKKKRRDNKENVSKSPVLINKNEQTEEPMLALLASQEKVFNMKMIELNSEHERKLRVLEERITSLKKENERLSGIVEGQNARIELRRKNDRCGSDIVKDYDRLLVSLEELKTRNEELELTAKNALCLKCKAFVSANNDLKGKMGRIREYLVSDNVI